MRVFLILIIFVGCAHQVNIVSPSPQYKRSKYDAKSSHAMVASQGEATSQAALSVLEKGGNIIDAFVTAS